MTETMQCPRKAVQMPGDTTLDEWVLRGKDRCCSYCGSWHPDEFLAFLSVAADPNQNAWIEDSDKDYKIYIRRPDVSNALLGAIKFYGWHLLEQPSEEIKRLYREAEEVSFRKSMANLDKICMDMEKSQFSQSDGAL